MKAPTFRYYYAGWLTTLGSLGMTFWSWFQASLAIGPKTGGATHTVQGFLFLILTAVLWELTYCWSMLEEKMRAAKTLEQSDYERSHGLSVVDALARDVRIRNQMVPPQLAIEAKEQSMWHLTDEEMTMAKELGMDARAYYNRYKRHR